MRGGSVIWVSALLIAGPVAGVSAGATSYSGPLPRPTNGSVPGEVARGLRLTALDHAPAVPAGRSLDLAAAFKLGQLPAGCDFSNPGRALHVAVAP